jgi:hypothetical protein
VLEELERLEGTPLGPAGRALPWLLLAWAALLAAWLVWWLWLG